MFPFMNPFLVMAVATAELFDKMLEDQAKAIDDVCEAVRRKNWDPRIVRRDQ